MSPRVYSTIHRSEIGAYSKEVKMSFAQYRISQQATRIARKAARNDVSFREVFRFAALRGARQEYHKEIYRRRLLLPLMSLGIQAFWEDKSSTIQSRKCRIPRRFGFGRSLSCITLDTEIFFGYSDMSVPVLIGKNGKYYAYERMKNRHREVNLLNRATVSNIEFDVLYDELTLQLQLFTRSEL